MREADPTPFDNNESIRIDERDGGEGDITNP